MRLEEDFGVTACGPKSEDLGQERYIINCCLLHLYCLFCVVFLFFLSVCGGVHMMPFSWFLLIIIMFLLNRIMFSWGVNFFSMV